MELCDGIVLEQREIAVEEYYAHLSREGGVVEAFMTAEEVRSPSVQVRMSPFGRAEVLSTHAPSPGPEVTGDCMR